MILITIKIRRAETVETEATKKGLTGSAIKIIAMACMFIDHFGASVYQALMYSGKLGGIESSFFGALTGPGIDSKVYLGYLILRCIGRISFPIYCFFLIEGFGYTRSKWKYLLRMMIFAVVSEVPFDMAIFGSFFYYHYQNVFFTLAIGLAMIWGIDTFTKRENGKGLTFLFCALGCITGGYGLTTLVYDFAVEIAAQFFGAYSTAVFFFGMVGAFAFAFLILMIALNELDKSDLLKKISVTAAFAGCACLLAEQTPFGITTDYGTVGIATILIIYLLRKWRMPSICAGCGVLSVFSFMEIPGFLCVPLIRAYNGERGKGNKYLFYAFYPVHLLILGLICFVLKLNPWQG